MFLSLICLQAIPVLQLFLSEQGLDYVHIEEEQIEEKSKQNKETKECLSLMYCSPDQELIKTLFAVRTDTRYAAPLLDFLTPPPDYSMA